MFNVLGGVNQRLGRRTSIIRLTRLPTELLKIISNQLTRKRNFAHFARATSKELRNTLRENYDKRREFNALLKQMNRTNPHYNTRKYKNIAHRMHQLYPNDNMTRYYKTEINRLEKFIHSLNEKTLENSLNYMLKNNGKNTKRLHQKTRWGENAGVVLSNIIIGRNGKLKINNR